jgi:protein ImuA
MIIIPSMSSKAEILARLQKDILSLQGFKHTAQPVDDIGLGRITEAFPNRAFPFAALHEFHCDSDEALTSSAAFICGILSSAIKGRTAIWISGSQTIYPPALQKFGITPEQVIFLHLRKEKEIAWAVEEALKCNALAAVVGEFQELSFTASRRYQLAIENSGVGCFVLRKNPKNKATAALTRWQVKPLQSKPVADLPGIGHPRWEVSLVKVRNGKPGTWELEWVGRSFRHPSKLSAITHDWKKKAG